MTSTASGDQNHPTDSPECEVKNESLALKLKN